MKTMSCPGCGRAVNVGTGPNDIASGPHLPNNPCSFCNGCKCEVCKPELYALLRKKLDPLKKASNMKLSNIVRTYGEFALSHFQESAVKNGDPVTASFIREYGGDILRGIADSLESNEQRKDVIDRASFVAHEACSLMYHKDIDPDEAVKTALEIMNLSEKAVADYLKKK